MAALFQVGLISGLVEGVSEGDVSFKILTQHGDTGLGTLRGDAGQMTALDGNFYAVSTDGTVTSVDPSSMPPFAMVTKFSPAFSFPLHNISGADSLNAALDLHLPSLNIFYMLRIEAELEWIKLCSESCVSAADPMASVLPDMQHGFELKDIKGALIATRCPGYGAGIMLPGYHYHFIDRERRKGGHVDDIRLQKAKVWVTPLRRFSLVLFNNIDMNEVSFRAGSAAVLGQGK